MWTLLDEEEGRKEKLTWRRAREDLCRTVCGQQPGLGAWDMPQFTTWLPGCGPQGCRLIYVTGRLLLSSARYGTSISQWNPKLPAPRCATRYTLSHRLSLRNTPTLRLAMTPNCRESLNWSGLCKCAEFLFILYFLHLVPFSIFLFIMQIVDFLRLISEFSLNVP